MRTFVGLLLAANLALFAYTELDRMNEGESGRLHRQLVPEKIKLLSPQQVAGLGPAKVAQLANVCLEWGPFTEAERPAALAALEPLQLGKQMALRRIESTSAYWVYLGPLPNRLAADRKVAELKSLGLKDYFILGEGSLKNAISLGVFKTADAANKFLETAREMGVNTAKSGARAQTIHQTIVVLRDPQPVQAEQLQKLKGDFAGSDVSIGPCDRT